jgi:two-component sensor histidine kinase
LYRAPESAIIPPIHNPKSRVERMAARSKTKQRVCSRKPPKTKAARATPSGPKTAAKPLVVGIGASAGGLEAFRTFLTHMPSDSGMSFVLVQHLDPNHRSMLVDLLRPHTPMPAVEAADGMHAEPNHIFITELDHRVKNILMVVTSLVSQTLRGGGSAQDFADEIQGRIQALSRVHNLLNVHGQNYADLRQVVEGELAIFRAGNHSRLVIDGTDTVRLTGRATQTVAMALHELATNAAKYGALSNDSGQVTIGWQVANSGEQRRLLLQWVETGGPTVKAPTRRGFGSQLIEDILTRELDANVRRDFKQEGVRCTIELPLTAKTGHSPGSAAPGGKRRDVS